MYARLAVDAPVPDLVIYLQAPVDVLLERIARRGIRYEQQIERAVPGEAAGSVRSLLPRTIDASPLLIVNAAQADFVSNEQDYTSCFAQIRRIRRGRHYYNPLKTADADPYSGELDVACSAQLMLAEPWFILPQ